MKKISVLVLLFSLSWSAVGQKKLKYVGYTHKGVVFGETLPNGLKDAGGGLLSDENYGVSRFTKGKSSMLWLEKITSRDDEGVPDWEVRDVLTFDKLKRNQQFLFSYSSPCTLKGKQKLDLIVMARVSGKKKGYQVLKAWQVDLKSEKFKALSTKNIRCG
jgi:hypothetical protein